MSVLAQKRVRVATMKATGKRYLLESFFGNRALLHGEVEGFIDRQTAHIGKPFWVDAKDIVSVDEMVKTPKLMCELLKQAAKATGATVQVQKRGARLLRVVVPGEPALCEAAAEIAKVIAPVVRKQRIGIDWHDKQTMLSAFLKVE